METIAHSSNAMTAEAPHNMEYFLLLILFLLETYINIFL